MSGSGDDRDFERAMGKVKPLGETRRRAVRRRQQRSSGTSLEPPRFEIERTGVSIYARRKGASRGDLERLRSGALRPENRLDLHGMTEESARESVFRFVRQSRASGLACVALIHGRGLRSPSGPVLKAALHDWLVQLPLARDVAAFGSAAPGQGGDGVTLVLLEPR